MIHPSIDWRQLYRERVWQQDMAETREAFEYYELFAINGDPVTNDRHRSGRIQMDGLSLQIWRYPYLVDTYALYQIRELMLIKSTPHGDR